VLPLYLHCRVVSCLMSHGKRLIIFPHSASCSVPIIETKCVYCVVRTESLNMVKAASLSFHRAKGLYLTNLAYRYLFHNKKWRSITELRRGSSGVAQG